MYMSRPCKHTLRGIVYLSRSLVNISKSELQADDWMKCLTCGYKPHESCQKCPPLSLYLDDDIGLETKLFHTISTWMKRVGRGGGV